MKKSKKYSGKVRKEYFQCIVEPSNEINIDFDLKNDIYSISGLVKGSVKYIREYQGDKKVKKLVQIGGGDIASLTQEQVLIQNFDKIYIVDTNGKAQFNEYDCAVTVVYEVNGLSEHSTRACIKYYAGFYLFGVDESKVHPEKIGWHLLLNKLKKENLLEVFGKVLIVTDHDLGAHELINSNKLPYYLTNYLPNNVKFGFAKSDKSGSFLEDAIKVVDRTSDHIKKQFKIYEDSSIEIFSFEHDDSFLGCVEVELSTSV